MRVRQMCTLSYRTINVTRHNFEELFPVIETSINSPFTSFCALDTEFTGLSINHDLKEHYADTLEERYSKLAQTGGKFIITQFGLAVVHYYPPASEEYLELNNHWQVHVFNFYVFPRPYGNIDERFMCQASALDFLAENGFDFNTCIRDGISYLNTEQTLKYKKRLDKEILNAKKDHASNEVEVKSQHDQEFCANMKTEIQAWLNDEDRDEILYIQNHNSYRRLLIYQVIRKHFPTLFAEKVKSNTIEICVATEQVKQERMDNKISGMKRKYLEAVGISRVIQAISNTRKPIVGHNAMLDLLYVCQHFHQKLPDSWQNFKTMVNEFFPIVYDTKHIAQSSPLATELNGTALGDLYREFEPKLVPKVLLHTENAVASTTDTSAPHEAGYDAYMTAISFLGLMSAENKNWKVSDTIETTNTPTSDQLRETFGNRINLMFSDVNTIDLGNQGQSMDRTNVYALREASPTPNSTLSQSQCKRVFSDFDTKRIVRVPFKNIYYIFLNDPLSALELQQLQQKNASYLICTYDQLQTTAPQESLLSKFSAKVSSNCSIC